MAGNASGLTTELLALARKVDLRQRLRTLLSTAVHALTGTLAASIVVLFLSSILHVSLPGYRIVLLLNAGALIAALVYAAVRRYDPQRCLLAADSAYDLKETLAAAYEFAQESADPAKHPARIRATHDSETYRGWVFAHARESLPGVSPTAIVRITAPRLTSMVAVLAVALLALMIIDATGLFARESNPIVQQGLFLADGARRLAERSEDDNVRELARQMEELGDQLAREQIDPEAANKKLEELGEQVEDQFRNLDRNPGFENPEDATAPPQTEDTVRRALQQGMSEGDVMEFFTRMSGRGQELPDIVEALEEATTESPNANLPVDEEALERLMNQLQMPPPAADVPSDRVNELQEADRIIEQSASGLAELTEGEPGEPSGEGSGTALARGQTPPQSEASAADSESEGGEGQAGGREAVEDRFESALNRLSEGATLRELRGEVTQNQIMDVIIRDMPSEALSLLDEEQRAAEFERVVENAIPRDSTPSELREVVKSYFLRITMRAADERDAEQGEDSGSE